LLTPPIAAAILLAPPSSPVTAGRRAAAAGKKHPARRRRRLIKTGADYCRVSGSTLRRAFSVAGPMAWNSLPDFIRGIQRPALAQGLNIFYI